MEAIRQMEKKVSNRVKSFLSSNPELNKLEILGCRYDGVVIFENKDKISIPNFTATTSTSGNSTLINESINIHYLEANDWIAHNMLTTPKDKISIANARVLVLIAISKMMKAGVRPNHIQMFESKLKDTAIEILDVSQYEWEQVLKSQASQLPF